MARKKTVKVSKPEVRVEKKSLEIYENSDQKEMKEYLESQR